MISNSSWTVFARTQSHLRNVVNHPLPPSPPQKKQKKQADVASKLIKTITQIWDKFDQDIQKPPTY